MSNVSPFANFPASTSPGARRVVGFEASSSSSFEHAGDVNHFEQNYKQTTAERPKRTSSLGQQLMLQKFEQQRPKLAINTSSKGKNRKLANNVISNTNTTTGEPSLMPGTLPGDLLQAAHAAGVNAQKSWLARSSTAPEPIPIPDISPSASRRHLHSKPVSRQPSPVANGTAGAQLSHLSRTSSTRPPTSPMSGYQTPDARERDMKKELEIAHLQASALQQALAEERQEVVRLRQELRRIALEQRAVASMPPSTAPSREASPSPMHLDATKPTTPRLPQRKDANTPSAFRNITMAPIVSRLPLANLSAAKPKDHDMAGGPAAATPNHARNASVDGALGSGPVTPAADEELRLKGVESEIAMELF